MSEQAQVSAAPSTAPVVEVERGALVNMTGEQRSEFRRTGELPAPPKPEGTAPSEETPAKPEMPEPPKKPQEQERRKPSAEKRIGELTSEVKRLKTELETLKTPQTPKTEPKPQVEAPQYTRPKPTVEDKDTDGKPKYGTYEDFVEDLSDWKAEQRWASQQRQNEQKAQQREMESKIAEAKQRYGEKFEQIIVPTVSTILNDGSIAPVIKTMLNDSEISPDLIFTIGSDQKELADFLQMAKTSPGKAIRYIALTESLIRDELKAPAPKAVVPAKPQTSAPKPPAEVGGRAATPGDAVDSAAKAGDFRSYAAERTRRDLARLRG